MTCLSASFSLPVDVVAFSGKLFPFLGKSFLWARNLYCGRKRMLDVNDKNTPDSFSEIFMPRMNNLDQNSLCAYLIISGSRKSQGQCDVKAEISFRSSMGESKPADMLSARTANIQGLSTGWLRRSFTRRLFQRFAFIRDLPPLGGRII